MRNFKHAWLLLAPLLLSGCSDNAHFFNSIENNSDGIHYSDTHQMNLHVTTFNKVIDESGFAPVLKCELLIENLKKGPWPQAWVAFNIDIYVKKQKLATLTKAGALESHQLIVFFDQNLPKFGYTLEDLDIDIQPISWMPTYPLSIETHETAQVEQRNDTEKPLRVSTLR